MRRLRLVFLFSIVGASLGAPPVAHADKEKARDHFRKGQIKYTLEKYDEAIAEFEQGYQEQPDAVFLYNIAQAHRLGGRPAKAIEFYRKYLAKVPDARNRKEVEDYVESLQKMSVPSEVITAPGGKVPVSSTPTTTVQPAEPPPATTTTPPEPAETRPPNPEVPPAAVTPPPPAKEEPKKSRLPLWIGVGVGVGLVVAAAAVVPAVLLTRPAETSTVEWRAR
jgi:tetratricopeptide (TPR) repeat protein